MLRNSSSQLLVLAASIVLCACSSHLAKISTQPTGPGMIAAPFGPGLPDLDRITEVAPASRSGPASPAPAAPLTTTNVKLSQIAGRPEAETTIAVNPANPQNIVAGAISTPLCYSYASLDGGQNWTQVALQIPLGFTSLGDPAVTFCGDGSAYYEVLVSGGAGGGLLRSGVYVYRSTDGGLTWSEDPFIVNDRVSVPQDITDKPWITCDATGSLYNGRVYVEYSNPQRVTCSQEFCRAIKVNRSTDQGATWGQEVVVSDNPQTPQNQGSLAIGPSGELYVAWDGTSGSNGDVGDIKVDKSTDGGVNFGTDVEVTLITPIAADPLFRRLTYPVIGADASNGPHRGNVYIAFADARYGDPDILLVRSTDGGATWSQPIRVNDDAVHNLADQWAPGLAVDSLGRVIVTFYDRRRYIGTEKYEIWGAISRDGGTTFDSNFLIGDTPSDVPFNVFLGDYDSVAASSDHLYTTWADQRVPVSGETPDIYSDRFPNIFAYDEVRNVAWSSATVMRFDAQDVRFGVDLDYDVAGGSLAELRADQAFIRVGCVASVWPAPPFVDTRVPPAGDGYYYLVRVHKGAGIGTYGDAWPFARPNVRDALDETLPTCP